MSGGTTTVINATLAGIIERSRESKEIGDVYAAIQGFPGIIKDHIENISTLPGDEIKKLIFTPASGFIGASRIGKQDIESENVFQNIIEKYNIGYFINIGGNGTVKQSLHIQSIFGDKLKIAALPKTVDNDFGDTDFKHMFFTPGFPSCIKYWAHKINIFNQENLGACQHDKVLILQTFGRETGFIAGSARVADPNRELPLIILLPEDHQPLEAVLKKIEDTVNKRGRAIVVMTEGYTISPFEETRDKSGQVMYSSSETTNAQLLVNACINAGIQARSFIPGIDQRDEILLTSPQDIEASLQVGQTAIDEFEKGNQRFIVTLPQQNITQEIKTGIIDLFTYDDYSREMPSQWINKENFDVTDAYINYLSKLFDKTSPQSESDILRSPFAQSLVEKYL